MQKYVNSFQNTIGQIITGATVSVWTDAAHSVPATIYSDNGVTRLPDNTVKTDTLGEFFFYAVDGRYYLSVAKAGVLTQYVDDILLFDPAPSTGAAGVGFTASVTGYPHASATTVETKLRNGIPVDVVSDYGADPSAVSDSTTAIQNAINDVSVAGGIVYFPVGTFKITSTLVVPVNSNVAVRLIGADQRSTVLSFVGSIGIGLRWGSATRDPSGTTTNNTLYGSVENMILNAGSGAAGITIFQAIQPQFFSMERVLIQGASTGFGMKLLGSSTSGLGSSASPHAWRGTYRKVWVTNCLHPFYGENFDENTFIDCNFEITKGVTASANSIFGIEIAQGLNNRFISTLIDGDTNGSFKGAYVGVMIDQPTNGAIQNNQFYGLVCEGFSRGIWIAGTVGGAMPLSTQVRGYYSSLNTTSYLNVQNAPSADPANQSIIEEITNTDENHDTSFIARTLTSKNPPLKVGGNPQSDGGGDIQLVLSNTSKNWAIRYNQTVSGALEFARSTAGGGSAFTTADGYFGATGGVVWGAATGGDKGSGTVNAASGFYLNGTLLVGVKDTAISTGVGSVKMKSANAATNSAWLPIQASDGTVYYVPAWTTNNP